MWNRYVFLFPSLAIFHLGLMMVGGMSFPFEFEIFGRRIHELESLTIGGGKSLSNLVEIFCALAIGVVGCLVMYIRSE